MSFSVMLAYLKEMDVSALSAEEAVEFFELLCELRVLLIEEILDGGFWR